MTATITDERLAKDAERLRDHHAPWVDTEYGVLCSCNEAMDADENCPTLRILSDRDRLRAELDPLKAAVDKWAKYADGSMKGDYMSDAAAELLWVWKQSQP